MMNKYKFSNEAFQNLVSVRIQLILDNWKDKWVYQWTSNKQKLLHNIDYDYDIVQWKRTSIQNIIQ